MIFRSPVCGFNTWNGTFGLVHVRLRDKTLKRRVRRGKSAEYAKKDFSLQYRDASGVLVVGKGLGGAWRVVIGSIGESSCQRPTTSGFPSSPSRIPGSSSCSVRAAGYAVRTRFDSSFLGPRKRPPVLRSRRLSRPGLRLHPQHAGSRTRGNSPAR